MGTQRIENAVMKILPNAKVVRVDADTMSRKHLFRQILGDFRSGRIDILVGTQMIAKGLDYPNVTLVGLVDADLSLHIPDFRANERTFQLLVQFLVEREEGIWPAKLSFNRALPMRIPSNLLGMAILRRFCEWS